MHERPDHDMAQDTTPAGRAGYPTTGRPGGRLTTVLSLAMLLGWAAGCLVAAHHRRVTARTSPMPERLQTWEGEGGRPVTPTGVDTDEASIAPAAATLS